MPDPVPREDTSFSTVAEKLIHRIRDEGALTVADYMDEVVSHYYAARKPFGVEGDFTTSPEISQMFGEMIGAWLTDLWLQSGKPEAVQLIELGPGRGTLAADIMRTVSSWPEFSSAISLHLVETSPALRQKQAETLRHYRPTWYDRLEDVPQGMSFIVANEFFDALPIHQFEKSGGSWYERRIGYHENKKVFELTLCPLEDDMTRLMPAEFLDAADGAVFEISPASLSVMETIGQRVAAAGGGALLIDYGHVQAGLGDTLQAMSRHKYANVLENPGEADLTAHVDFGTLAMAASPLSRVHGPVTQGEFLSRLGIVQRAEQLRAVADDMQRKDIELALYRLVAPSEMGELFKVLALTSFDSAAHVAGFAEMEETERAEISDDGTR